MRVTFELSSEQARGKVGLDKSMLDRPQHKVRWDRGPSKELQGRCGWVRLEKSAETRPHRTQRPR